MNLPIYLDYASTTPVDPAVADRMVEFLTPSGHLATLHHVRTCLAGKRRLLLRTHELKSPI